MIGILLAILKWIVIFVLAVLGLTFFMIIVILLVPVRYRLQGSRSPEKSVLTASGKISWLLSILAVTFSYDQEFSWRIRICGIPLRQKENQAEDNSEDLTEEQLAQIAELEKELTEEAIETSKLDSQSDPRKNLQSDPVVKTSHNTEPELRLQAQDISTGKMPGTIRSISARIAGFKEKIHSLKEQADIWIAFIKSDEVKQLIATCKKQIRQILRHLIPTSLKVQGNYGFEDPSLTGKITGVICALPSKLQKNIHLQPHFQEACLDGEFVLKGRIRLGSLLWPLICIVVKPCTWKAYKRYRNITNPKPAGNEVKASAKGEKGAKSTKKKSGEAGGSHKKNAKNIKNDPYQGGKQ